MLFVSLVRWLSLLFAGILALFPPSTVASAAPAPLPDWNWITDETGRRLPTADWESSVPQDWYGQPVTIRLAVDFALARFFLDEKPVFSVEPDEIVREFSITLPHTENSSLTWKLQARGTDGPSAVCLILQNLTSGQSIQLPAMGQQGTTRRLGPIEDTWWYRDHPVLTVDPSDNYQQWKLSLATPDAPPSEELIQVTPGFEVLDLCSSEPGAESWISLAFTGDQQILVAKEKKGLLKFNCPPHPTRLENPIELPLDAREARGLIVDPQGTVWINANVSEQLFRWQSPGPLEAAGPRTRAGGHGRNDLALGSDGALHLIHGDSVTVPPKTPSRIPSTRPLDPGDNQSHGHWIRFHPDSQTYELMAQGLRNPYGIAQNADGEWFTYDADAEHDMGAPWYRPTRIRHLVSGADYGWRKVTGAWPPYYPEHPEALPETLDIGKGSPTALAFAPSNFGPYGGELFVLDWTYGRVFRVVLTPRGSSYLGRAYPFLKGSPLNVTDLAFSPDGDLFLLTGGRGTRSKILRVTPQSGATFPPKPETTEQARKREEHARHARIRRTSLESTHGPNHEDKLELIWEALREPDAGIRQAARIALEHIPYHLWIDRLLVSDQSPPALAWLAAIRKSASMAAPAMDYLASLDWSELSRRDLDLHSRILSLAAAAPDVKTQSLRQTCQAAFSRLPTGHWPTDRQLSLALAPWPLEGWVPKLMHEALRAPDGAQQLHWLFLVRNKTEGWSESTRSSFFDLLQALGEIPSGAGMPNFLISIRRDALEVMPKEQQEKWLGYMVTRSRKPPSLWEPPESFFNRPTSQPWTLGHIPELVNASNDHSPNLEQGWKAFIGAQCVACHTLDGIGHPLGPDLTHVAARFGVRDLLVAILDPSAALDEKFASWSIELHNGTVLQGSLVPGRDYREDILRILPNPLSPSETVEIRKQDVALAMPSGLSPMPEGLLNILTREEILDLLALLRADGLRPPAPTP